MLLPPADEGRVCSVAKGLIRRQQARILSRRRVEPNHVLAWRSQDGNWVWTFVLEAQDRRTRLISRNRFRLSTPIASLGMLLMEPASLVMERKMLLGVKQRAEELASARA